MIRFYSIAVFSFFFAFSAYAEKQHYLHLKYKNGTDAGVNYYSSSHRFQPIVSLDKSAIRLIVKDKHNLNIQQEISIKDPSGLPLAIESYHVDYVQGDTVTDPGGALVKIKGFDCPAPRRSTDSVTISKLVFNSQNKLSALHLDFSKGCQNFVSYEEDNFITGSIVIYHDEAAKESDINSSFRHHFYDDKNNLVSLSATDETHNLEFQGDSSRSSFSVVHSEEHTPIYGENETIFEINSYAENKIYFLSPVEFDTDYNNHDGLEFEFHASKYCAGSQFVRARISNLSIIPNHDQTDLEGDFSLINWPKSDEIKAKSIKMQYNVYCGRFDAFGAPPELIAFGTVDLKDLPDSITSKVTEAAVLQQGNLYLTESLKSATEAVETSSSEVSSLKSENSRLVTDNAALKALQKSANTAIPQLIKGLNQISTKYCKTNRKINTACRNTIASATSKLEQIIQKQ